MVLLALVLIAFGRTLHFGFINYDDNEYVYQNPAISGGLSLHSVLWAFDHVHADNWHPLTTISHMADCQIYGLRPFGHHLTNVILHAAGVVLLYLTLRELTGAVWRSAFVAALFAIHPLRVESVAWISERKDVLSGVFFMLTLRAYARWARKPDTIGYEKVVLYFLIGLLCKPMLVTVPCVLILLDYWPLGRLRSASEFASRVKEKGWLFLLAALSCVATVGAQRYAIQPMERVSLASRVADALMAYAIYVGKMIYPVHLTIFYPVTRNGWPPWEIAGAGVLVALVTAVALKLRAKEPALIVGWLWYLGMLVPVIGILQVGEQACADRYTYLPEIGLGIGAVWAGADWTRKWKYQRPAAAMAACMVISVLLALTWRQAGYWRDSETLWRHEIQCAAENPIEHNSLGNALLDQGRTDEATAEYREALRIDPVNLLATANLGNSLLQEGETDAAIVEFRKALEINPAYTIAQVNLGAALLSEGRAGEVIAECQAVLRTAPACADAYSNMGAALLMQGRYEEARAAAEKALELEPENVLFERSLALMLASIPRVSLRDGKRAVALAETANRATGGRDPRVLRALAAAYAETGDFPKAVEIARAALGIAGAGGKKALAEKLNGDVGLYERGLPLRQADPAEH